MKINPLKYLPNRSLVAMALAVIAGLPVLGQSEQHSDGHRSAYFKNGEIHANAFGEPEGKPSPRVTGISNPPRPRRVTSWFFSGVQNHPQVGMEDGDLHHFTQTARVFIRSPMPRKPTSTRLGPGRQKHSDLELKEPARRGIPRYGGKDRRKTWEEMALTNRARTLGPTLA